MEQNAAEAVKWYRKAADQGDTKAQYNLGVMSEKLPRAPVAHAARRGTEGRRSWRRALR